MLHYLVRATNTHGAYGAPTVAGYYAKLAAAFKALVGPAEAPAAAALVVDCANGVGGLQFRPLLAEHLDGYLAARLTNDGAAGSGGQLNHEVRPGPVRAGPGRAALTPT